MLNHDLQCPEAFTADANGQEELFPVTAKTAGLANYTTSLTKPGVYYFTCQVASKELLSSLLAMMLDKMDINECQHLSYKWNCFVADLKHAVSCLLRLCFDRVCSLLAIVSTLDAAKLNMLSSVVSSSDVIAPAARRSLPPRAAARGHSLRLHSRDHWLSCAVCTIPSNL